MLATNGQSISLLYASIAVTVHQANSDGHIIVNGFTGAHTATVEMQRQLALRETMAPNMIMELGLVIFLFGRDQYLHCQNKGQLEAEDYVI